MQVTIIGSGNVGTVLGRVLVRKNNIIRQVYSRNEIHARALAEELNAQLVADLSMIDKDADLYLLAVTDDAIAGVASRLSLGDTLILHTAGSVSKQVLATASTNYGVCWPMKMIRKSMMELGPATIVVDGNTNEMIEQARQFARQFSDTIAVADDLQREKMHMVAAVASNFSNHLYHLAADYCEREGLDFSIFYPIIEETARQIRHTHPSQVQAGPAFRGDTETMEKHRRLLQQYPSLEKLYELISSSITQKNSELYKFF